MLWQIKAAIGLSALLLLAGAYFYVKYLNSTIDDLQTQNTQLTETNKSQKDAIEENDRRTDILNRINNIGSKEKIVIEKHYQSQLEGIDKSIKEGKDREVGPLLLDFFNQKDE